MLILEIINEVYELLQQKRDFHILVDDGDLYLVKKKVSVVKEIDSAHAFFKECLEYLRFKSLEHDDKIQLKILSIHTLWFSRFEKKGQSLSDRLCALLLYADLLQFSGKITQLQWFKLEGKELFEKNNALYKALNFRIDLGAFFQVELKDGSRIFAPLKDLQKKSCYSKRGNIIGYDLFFQDELILSFDKKGGMKKDWQVYKSYIRSVS